jgi:2-polyprenyl-3-methyl-5-hydroxy-6-metoxy-1,4-benzoquinol methylase
MLEKKINCLFCDSYNITTSTYENTIFNNKEFEYLKCTNCKLVFLNPLPTTEDYIKMYPIEYQGKMATIANGSYDTLFQKINLFKKSNSQLLDYGCGNGRFVVEAIQNGYTVTGTEYNADLVKSLNQNFRTGTFLTIEEFYNTDKKYDIIFLSNVLEHLSNPKEIMLLLKNRLNKNGIFVIEGPIETNFNLTMPISKLLFYIRKRFLNKKANHIPTHIFYSNNRNQEQFFISLGLQTLSYEINETHWPFPAKYTECIGLKQKVMFYIADVSVRLNKYFKKWGNNFIYIGKIK